MIEREEVQKIFDYLETVEDELQEGDKQFYLSLKWQHTNTNLSSSQIFYLERMHKKYGKEEMKKMKDFEKNYSSTHRLIACRVAKYYDAQFPRYYGNIVDKVLLNPEGHILGYKEYNKMCNNKYAKKVLSAYESEVKFSVGDVVQIRTNNRVDLANAKNGGYRGPNRATRQSRADKVCMVLEANALPITRAAKGARVYKVLIIDEDSPIFVHESDLKKHRRQKK